MDEPPIIPNQRFAPLGRVRWHTAIDWWLAGAVLFYRHWLSLCLIAGGFILLVNIVVLMKFLIVLVMFQGIFYGGIMYACYQAFLLNKFTISDVFMGFKWRLMSLTLLQFIIVMAMLMVMIVVGSASGLIGQLEQSLPVVDNQLSDFQFDLHALTLGQQLLLVFGLVILFVLLVVSWLAPITLMLDRQATVLAAMRDSFQGVIKNLTAFLLFALFLLVLLWISSRLHDLIQLIIFPVLWGAIFAAYRSIFMTGSASNHSSGSVEDVAN